MIGAGYMSGRVPGGKRCDGFFKRIPAFQRLRLPARPSADPAEPVSAIEVLVGLGIRNRRNFSPDSDLPSNALPVEAQRGLWVHCEMFGLIAAEIRVENETGFIKAFEENHSHIGLASIINGCQCHGIGIIGFFLACLRVPFAEKGKRINVIEVTRN